MTSSLPVLARRILVALGEERGAAGVLESVARLAQTLDAEVRGLFIEDADLLRLAGLPFARELGLATATSRRLQHPDIERGWQRQAMRLQEQLAAIALRQQVRWSFQVVRGQVAARVTQQAGATDLIALTGVIRMELWREAPCSVLVLPAGTSLAPPVAVLVDAVPDMERAVQQAVAVVSGFGATGAPEALVMTIDQAVSMTSQAEIILANSGMHGRVWPAAVSGAAALVAQLRALRVRTLVLTAGSLDRHPWLQQVCARPPCAVWIVR